MLSGAALHRADLRILLRRRVVDIGRLIKAGNPCYGAWRDVPRRPDSARQAAAGALQDARRQSAEGMMDLDWKYWMQDRQVLNVGDFLSQFFMEHLFFGQPTSGQELRIVGCCIDDMCVPLPAEGTDTAPVDLHHRSRPAFWGCRLRSERGRSDDRLDHVEIVSVRGPQTRSALRLGNTVPIGDPGLLLPPLHKAATGTRSRLFGVPRVRPRSARSAGPHRLHCRHP